MTPVTTHSACGFRLITRGRQLFAVEFPKSSPKHFDRSALDTLTKTAAAFHLDLAAFSPFRQAVYRALLAIPPGQTRTYSQIAQAIGHPNAARAVGGACAANPLPIRIPCHRVVSKSGPGEFTAGKNWKLRLLELERQRRPSHLKTAPASA